MKITFDKKNAKDDHLVIIYKHGLILDKSSLLDLQQKQILNIVSNLTKEKNILKQCHYTSKKVKLLTISKIEKKNQASKVGS